MVLDEWGELAGHKRSLILSRAHVIIARKSHVYAFLASFNRNMAHKRYPYCEVCNGFWSVVHPVEYV